MACCCCSVTKSCPTLCGVMNCSMPGFPVLHCLPEFPQTCIHWVSGATQPSHPLSPPSPVVDMSAGESKVQWVKQQYCIGSWNVRSMNQGKLDLVKQEMIRVNIDILGISELKWTEMGRFNSDDHVICCCGHESLRRSGALIVNKSPKCSSWMQSQKWQNDSICFQGKPFNITVIQVYAPTANAEEAE